MDIDLNFSSDTTYCSSYENTVQPEKRKRKKISKQTEDSKFLDQVHKEVILHLEGKILIGRREVLQYMKRISAMKLKNPKDQYFSKKIQSSLLKIYSLTKQFERSLSIGNISSAFDPIECLFSKDFELTDVGENNPKQILLQSPSVNDEKASFPLDILTNNNFMSSSENVCTPVNKQINELEENNCRVESNGNKELHSSDIFLSENSEVYIDSSINSKEGISTTCHFKDTYSETFNPVETACSINKCVKDIEKKIYFTENDAKQPNNISSNNSMNKNNLEECISKITKLCANLLIKHNPNITEVSEMYLDNKNFRLNVAKPNLQTVRDLGNLFHELYNTNIYKLYCDTGKNMSKNQNWQNIENDIAQSQTLARDVHESLEELFEKLRIEEIETDKVEDIILGKPNIHNFGEEDKKKLDVEDLMNANRIKLEQISEEFKTYASSRVQESTKDVDEDEFQTLNWKNLLD